MKKLISILILLTASAVLAATLTIEVPTADVPRVQEAFGSIGNLGRPATPAEVQRAIQNWLNESTKDYERRKNMAAFVPPALEGEPSPTPTPTPTPAPSPTATP